MRLKILLLLFFGCVGFVFWLNQQLENSVNLKAPNLEVRPQRARKNPNQKVLAIQNSNPSVLLSAATFIDVYRDALKIQPYHDYTSQESKTPLGTRVDFLFSQDGIPIVGMRITLEMDSAGRVSQVKNHYTPAPKIDISDSLSLAELSDIVEENDPHWNIRFDSEPVIFARGKAEEACLAYTAHVENDRGRASTLLVRATDGQILSRSFARMD